jgi:hypothetical protein
MTCFSLSSPRHFVTRRLFFRSRLLVSVPACLLPLLLCCLVAYYPAQAQEIIHGTFDWPDRGVRWYDDANQPDSVATVDALAVHSDGRLYVGGLFNYVGESIHSSSIAAWDGESWQDLNNEPSGSVLALHSVGPDLYAGGYFTSVNGVAASRIARWDGQNWHPLGSGTFGPVRSIVSRQENGVPVLYVGGGFTGAGGLAARRVARWDGQNWSALGPGLNAGVMSLAIIEHGTGPILYACGTFTHTGGVGGQLVNHVAKWDFQTQTWSALGQGITDENGYATSLAVFDDGNGPALYMGGFFAEVDGKPIKGVARWDGEQWSQPGDPPLNFVEGLKTRSNGQQTALYACGGVMGQGRLAKWDGVNWTRFEPVSNARPLDIEFYDSGHGPQLHVGGGEALFNTKIARFSTPDNGGGFACGDFDGDGMVTQADLGILLAAFDNCPGPNCPGDANGDGIVDQQDLGILLAHFGQECS